MRGVWLDGMVAPAEAVRLGRLVVGNPLGVLLAVGTFTGVSAVGEFDRGDDAFVEFGSLGETLDPLRIVSGIGGKRSSSTLILPAF